MSTMNPHSAPIIYEVLGNVEPGPHNGSSPLRRSALNICYGAVVQPTPPYTFVEPNIPALFNTVGSRVKNHDANELHLPVIDLNGGVIVQRLGAKAILYAPQLPEGKKEKTAKQYTPESLLRDILGDNGIDLEVFGAHAVRAIVLRSRGKRPFMAKSSSSEGHSHLYVQQAFSKDNHAALLDELARVGIISETWAEYARVAGMGIVRTPWNTKRPEAESS